MPDIATGLLALKNAFDLAKDLNNATKAYSDAEVQLKISALYTALSEARIELADSQIEMHELKNQVAELQQKINASDDLEFKDSMYWRKEPQEGKPNGPFCPNCYEGSSKKLSSMSKASSHFKSFGNFRCNTCGRFVK